MRIKPLKLKGYEDVLCRENNSVALQINTDEKNETYLKEHMKDVTDCKNIYNAMVICVEITSTNQLTFSHTFRVSHEDQKIKWSMFEFCADTYKISQKIIANTNNISDKLRDSLNTLDELLNKYLIVNGFI